MEVIVIMLNYKPEKEVNIFSGSQLDVYNAIEFFIGDLGFVLADAQLVIRDIDEIKSADDIKSGDIIPFITPDRNEIACLGYDISKQEDLERIVYAIGQLNSFEEDISVGVTLHDLNDKIVRDMYESFMDTFKREHTEVLKNFKDILIVEATQLEMHQYLIQEQQRASEKILTVHHVDNESDDEFEINKPDDIESGMFLFGQVERDDGTPQIGLVGYNIEDDAILEYLSKALVGFGKAMEDIVPEIRREKFSDLLL